MFAQDVSIAEKVAAAADGGVAFAFIEGSLVKAVREGSWLLLDEINLAPPEVKHLLSYSFLPACQPVHSSWLSKHDTPHSSRSHINLPILCFLKGNWTVGGPRE